MQRRLRPLEVVDEEDEGPPGGKSLEETPDRPSDLLARNRLVGQADEGGDPSTNLVGPIRTRKDRSELGESVGAWLAVPDPRCVKDEIPDRPIRDPVAVWQAARPQDEGVPGHPCE